MQDFAWLLPTAKEAYENREAISSIWEKVVTALLGRKSSIAVTGTAGGGKTVLMDHLTGRAYKHGYRPPGQSPDLEKARLNRDHKRIRFSVLPGQASPERWEAVDELFHGDDPVDGVIHVVSNGFATIRTTVAEAALVATAGLTTTQAFRDYQLNLERTDLLKLTEQMRISIRKHRKPRWMLVAATKVDLYHGGLAAAEQYYSAEGTSPFSQILREFQDNVGRDNFGWGALPVCASLEDFLWNGETTTSVLRTDARDHYVAQFARAIERRCAS
jgi:hypothetical protein